jgi:ATP-dependent RNA helicase DeaD
MSEEETSESGEQVDRRFAALGLRDELLKTISSLGYEEATPIQRETIPHLLAGKDLLGQAATGTGKTAAFALPVLNNIEAGPPGDPVALVVVPTRELAMQVSEAMFKYGREQNIKVVPVYGGQPIQRQLQALKRGAHVVVATPGRAIDLIKRRALKLEAVRTVILDEADEMLDMGFTEDIETILESTPEDRQTVLFSATMPPRIEAITKKYQTNPIRVRIGAGDTPAGKDLIRQTVYIVARSHKASALGRILDIESPDAALVFCRTRTEVDELTTTMNGRGYRAEALHGGMDQKQRDRVMGLLRDGTAELLIATDVAARGLDVDTLTHVVNYDVPSAAESYVHRIGRVGRAGREGVAITLAEPRQRRLLGNIERLTKQTITVEKVPSVADLRTRQIELTVTAISDALAGDDLDDYNPVLDGLAGEHDDRTIALAAIKLVHEARGATVDEVEIPDASHHSKHKTSKFKDKQRGGKFSHDKGGAKSGSRGKTRPDGVGLIYVSLGTKVGIRPGDLVGAIANESGLTGAEIGPIRIAEHYSTVGVPDDAVDRVCKAISATSIRGKRAKARPFVE